MELRVDLKGLKCYALKLQSVIMRYKDRLKWLNEGNEPYK